jgi:hypothetical protein
MIKELSTDVAKKILKADWLIFLHFKTPSGNSCGKRPQAKQGSKDGTNGKRNIYSTKSWLSLPLGMGHQIFHVILNMETLHTCCFYIKSSAYGPQPPHVMPCHVSIDEFSSHEMKNETNFCKIFEILKFLRVFELEGMETSEIHKTAWDIKNVSANLGSVS